MKQILPFLFAFFLFTGCTKEKGGGAGADKEAPIIKITSPSNNQAFVAGQAVSITADITDQSKLAEIHLEITNTTTGVFITHEHYVPDSSGYKLSRVFTATSASVYKIKVEADDAEGNSSDAEVSFAVN